MPAFNPYVALMNSQAQDIGSPTDPSAPTAEEMAMSQDLPPDPQAEAGGPSPFQYYAALGKAAARSGMLHSAHSQSMSMSMPQSVSESSSQDQRNQDLIKQYSDQSKGYLAQQNQGLKQLEENYNQMRAAPQNMDYTPFASFAKFLNPNDQGNDALISAAKESAPETKQAREEKLLKLQDMIQQRKGDISKQSLSQLADMIKAQKGSDELSTLLKMSTIDKNKAIGNAMSARPAQFDRSIAERAHQNILTKLATNKNAQQKLQSIQGIDNAGKIIEDAPIVTPQIFHDYQQALVGAIQRGNSGIAERAERYMKSTGIDAATIQQYLTGNPVSIPQGQENAFYKATQGFAKSERGNIEKQYGQILGSISSGQAHIYDKHPELKKDLGSALDQYKGMAESQSGAPQVGDEHDGYIYKGGDPSKPESWEKK
jgi:hypothetical protein